MNNTYDFTETGGFPLDQGILNDLQSGILEAEAAISSLVGPLVILSGCVIAGGNVGNGVVAINGKIMPFIGGPLGTNVLVVDTPTDLTYEDGAVLPSEVTQVAQFGDDGVQFNDWADFVSVESGGILAAINTLQTDDETQADEITTLQAIKATVLASGNTHLGDINPLPAGAGQTFAIPFTTALADTNWIVVMCLVMNSGTTVQNDVDAPVLVSKSTTGFSVCIHEASAETQDLSLDWMIISF